DNRRNRFVSWRTAMSSSVRFIVLLAAAVISVGCSAAAPTTNLPGTTVQTASGDRLTNALIAVNFNTKALEYWPIGRGGGDHPQTLSKPGLFNGFGMAANGHVVYFDNENPPEVLRFDVRTQGLSALPDPFGTP